MMFQRRSILLVAVLLVAAILTPHPVQAATLTSCTYEDLLSLIQAGENVQFGCSGTIVFPFEIPITGNTTLDASGQSVILQSSGANRLFNVNAGASLTLRGLTLTGRTTFGTGLDQGGVILNSGTLRLEQTTINHNYGAANGGAIYNDGGSLSLNNSTLDDNEATTSGGGIYNSGGQVELVNSTITYSQADHLGGAIYSSGSLRITNSTLAENDSRGVGGAIYNDGTVDVTNTTFFHNLSDGGVIVNANGSMSLTNCTLTNNHPTSGTIFNRATLTVTNCTFTGNLADEDGNTFVQLSGSATFRHTIMSGNEPSRANCVIFGGTVDANGNNQSDDNSCPGFRPLK